MVFLGSLMTACSSFNQPIAPITGPESSPQSPLVFSIPVRSSPPLPGGSLFFSLPSHKVGETVEAAGYQITLDDFDNNGDQISLFVTLQNHSEFAIDLNWAIQLRDEKGGLIQPLSSGNESVENLNSYNENPESLNTDEGIRGMWRYSLEGRSVQDLKDYRLIYSPRGWSGPVFVFKLFP